MKIRMHSIPDLIGPEGIFIDGDWIESKDQDESGTVRLVQLADIGEGIFLNKSNRHLTKSKAIKLKCTFLKKGDILIARMPDPLGRCCIFPGLEQESVTAVDVCIVRPSPSIANNIFLMHLINNRYVRNQIHRFSTGTTRRRISRGNLSKIKLPIPPLDDQIRTATLLSRVDSMIAKRKKGLSLLDELLKGIFLEMFGDPIRNEKGWNTTSFSKIGDFSSGGTPSKKRKDYWTGSFPWVSPKDMKVTFISDSQDHIAEKVFEETSLKRIDPGHLLVVVRGMILAHSFPVAINTVPVAINQDMKAIYPNPNYNVHYLMICLHAMKRQVLTLISSAGHGTKRFDVLAMNKLLVPSPPIDLQEKFELIVEKIEALKSLYNKSLNELENLYGALSQKAFKGKLDLSRIPIEPLADAKDLEPEQLPIAFPPLDHKVMADPIAREKLLRQIFKDYFTEHPQRAGSFKDFWNSIEFSASDYMDDESPPLGPADYDKFKTWLFDLLKSGQAEQRFNEEKNKMELRTKP